MLAVGVVSCTVCGLPAADIPHEEDAVIKFVNGDRLHGRLDGVASNGAYIVWARGQERNEIAVGSIASIHYRRPLRASHIPEQLHRIAFKNGDTIMASSLTFDGASFSIQSPMAGRLTADRSAVAAVDFNAGEPAPVLAFKPGGSGWTLNYGGHSWTATNGYLMTTGGNYLGWNGGPLPDMIDVRFDARWSSGFPEYRCLVFCRGIGQNGSVEGGLGVAVHGKYAVGYIGDPESSSRMLNEAMGRGVETTAAKLQMVDTKFKYGENCWGHAIRMLVNRKTKSFWVFYNGEQIGEWKNVNAKDSDLGNAIYFKTGYHAMVQIRNFRVLPWDGVVPEAKSDAGAENSDRLKLRNGDKVDGVVTSISQAGCVITAKPAGVEGKAGSLSLPLANLSRLVLNPNSKPASAGLHDAVHLELTDGESIGGLLVSASPGSVAVSNSVSGRVTIPAQNIRRIDCAGRNTPAGSLPDKKDKDDAVVLE